jgi:hypothetical protein
MSAYSKSVISCLVLHTFCASMALATSPDNKAAPETGKVYMSFSGGGYHAHAGASSVMMSLMDRVRATAAPDATIGLADITKNVEAFSSNSGGSWFLSQAAYTTKFRTSLEAVDGWKTYTAPDGYFGQAYKYIASLDRDKDVCLPLKLLFPDEYDKCTAMVEGADSYLKFLLSGGDANWHELAVNAVFGQKFDDPSWHTMADDVLKLISDERQDWAKDKSLIFASSMLTETPALNYSYGWATIQSMQGKQNGDVVPGAAPVIFAVPGASGDTMSNFLPGGDTEVQYGTAIKVDASFLPDDRIKPFTLPASLSTHPARVIDVAASSSAAGGGFIDVPDMHASGLPADVAALLANFAPAFTLRDGTTFNGPFGMKEDLHDLSDKLAVRLADGGFVDNTAVAYMLRYMADNKKLTDGFNILSMDNFPKQPIMVDGGKAQLPTGPDVAGLFGFPNPKATQHTSKLFGVFSYTGIVPHVFESAPYFMGTGENAVPTKGPDWCAWIEPDGTKADNCVTIKVTNDHPEDKPCDMYLSYTKYEVKIREFDETENDDYFGLSEKTGVTGTLHVFSNLGSKPGVVPDDDEQARCYAKLMEAVHITVTGDNLFGNTLASLLGL